MVIYKLFTTKLSKKEGKDQESNNQAPHLTQDTTWESNENTPKHRTQESQEVSSSPVGDHMTTKYRQENMTNMEN